MYLFELETNLGKLSFTKNANPQYTGISLSYNGEEVDIFNCKGIDNYYTFKEACVDYIHDQIRVSE